MVAIVLCRREFQFNIIMSYKKLLTHEKTISSAKKSYEGSNEETFFILMYIHILNALPIQQK